MKRLLFMLVPWFLLIVPAVYSQNAQFMDRVFATKTISYSQASYLVLVAAGISKETDNEAACFAKATDQGWLPKSGTLDQPIQLAEMSYILMQAFKVPGGLLYTLFPGTRYAYKELAFKSFIQAADYPDAVVPGTDAIRLLSQVMELNK